MALERLLGAVRDEVVRSTVDLYTQGQTLAENADLEGLERNTEEIKKRTRQAKLVEGMVDDLHTRSSVGGAEQPDEELVIRALEKLISPPPLAAVTEPIPEPVSSVVVEPSPVLPQDAADGETEVIHTASNGMQRDATLPSRGISFRGPRHLFRGWVNTLKDSIQ